MKKFVFALEKVLEVKEIEEKIIQRNLANVQNQIFEIQKKITAIGEKVTSEKKKLKFMNDTITKSNQIMLHYKYIDSLNKEIENCNDLLKTLFQKENEIKAQLLAKTREKKAIERLKEIKYEEYKKEYSKSQQNFLDDISIQTHRLKVENA